MSGRFLILCTGNSCRSQMAEGFLKSYLPDAEVFSAGTRPAERVHPRAVEAMSEVGVDISGGKPEMVDEYLSQAFDYVITVCGSARDNCPVFSGSVKHKVHIGFDDPAEATGTDDEVMAVFRRVRDEIAARFKTFADETRNGLR